jgi:hypothetical protein
MLHFAPTEPPTPEEIKAFRRKHRLTQMELAALLGLRSGDTTISSWENYGTDPTTGEPRPRATPAPYIRQALLWLDHDLGERRRAMRREIKGMGMSGGGQASEAA